MIAKVIELFPATPVHLALEDFCCDKTFLTLLSFCALDLCNSLLPTLVSSSDGYGRRSCLSSGKRFDPRLPIQKNPLTESNFFTRPRTLPPSGVDGPANVWFCLRSITDSETEYSVQCRVIVSFAKHFRD
jgi:hypothetical protein